MMPLRFATMSSRIGGELVRLGETPDFGAQPVDRVVQFADVADQRGVEHKGAHDDAADQHREPEQPVDFLQ